jgi:hypothetical protein
MCRVGVVHGDPGRGYGGHGEGEAASDHCVSPAHGVAVSAIAGMKEVTLAPRPSWLRQCPVGNCIRFSGHRMRFPRAPG